MESLVRSIGVLLALVGIIAVGSHVKADESRLLDDLFMNYDSRVRPDGGHALEITHQYELLRIVDMDVQKQVLTVDAWEMMMWRDERLVWDKEAYSVKDLRLPVTKVWTPDIVIYNKAAPVVFKLRESLALVNSTGHVIYIPDLQIKIYCDVDDHIAAGDEVHCKIILGSWTCSAADLDLQPMDSETYEINMSDFSDFNRDWAVESTHVEKVAKQFDCCPEVYVTLEYVINLKRKNHLSYP